MATKALPLFSSQVTFFICLLSLLNGCRNDRDHVEGSSQAAVTAASGVRTYSTAFPQTENPIGEKGTWLGGSAAGASISAGGHLSKEGRLWGDVQTASGLAFGVDEPTQFGDPTAILTGAWGPDQAVVATVKIVKTPTVNCCKEVELRLRTTISNYSITGYEAYCSVMPDQPYCHIARWNGPNGSYWNFETGSSAAYLVNGDRITATVTGRNPTQISLWKNGVLLLKAQDTGAPGGGFGAYGPFTSGNPGIGFYDSYDGNWSDFGFSSFSATDGNPGAVTGSVPHTDR